MHMQLEKSERLKISYQKQPNWILNCVYKLKGKKKNEMFDNSHIEHSENEESDSHGETNISEEKESSKPPTKKQLNKEDGDDIDADPESNFIKWSFGKEC